MVSVFIYSGLLLKWGKFCRTHDARLHAEENVERLHLAPEFLPAAIRCHPVATLESIVETLIGPDVHDLADIANLSRKETGQLAEKLLLKRQASLLYRASQSAPRSGLNV